MINLDNIKFRGLQETGIPYHLLTDQPIRATKQCSNCGKLVPIGECNYLRTLKTYYGGSLLPCVCKDCADDKKIINIISKIDSKSREDKNE